ncbi:DNA primase [Pararhodospirillum photometricum]|uniref:DNA primase n=1 Tax=Pararhodospirillum photometricum DSM 122 TaxID=1150469 RepID=H6SR75_PARPM|nr:DNA primase [Pararhodospirillum photometricum]CCG09797.1 DNA primase [Pararhodospirillum photometricum DSM 122]
MSWSEGFLDELRTRLTLSVVVGRRVRLIRKGREFHGLCPFHNEKTPSFTVNDEKGFFHCFGCGAHGDVIGFEMRAANLPFREAVERLAAEAGLDLPQETPRERDRAKRSASSREIMEQACVFFQRALRGPEGKTGLAYLRARGLDDALIERFRLGYAPAGNALRAHLLAQGVSEGMLLDLGLASRPQDGRAPYDTFRNRVTFPITDPAGRVVAFGARLLGEGQPKYLNSPETALFHKGRTLYNLPLAREAARSAGTLVVAEGYMDVIALTRIGFGHAVAPLGTALTEGQMETLWTTTPAPILCFDGDAAGQRAAGRALERALPLLTPQRSLRFALLPPGRDPDDLARDGGPETMGRILDAALPLSEMAWRLLALGARLDTPEGRAALESAVDAFVDGITDRTVHHHFRNALRERFWTLVREQTRAVARPSNAAQGQFARSLSGQGRRPVRGGNSQGGAPPLPPPPSPARLREEALVATVLFHPWLFDHVGERLGTMIFLDPTLDRLRQEIVMSLSSGKALDRQALHDQLTTQGFAASLAALARPGLFVHAGFAREMTDPALVRAGWDHTYEIHRREDLREDSRRAGQRLKETMTQDALDHLLAVKEQDPWAEGGGLFRHRVGSVLGISRTRSGRTDGGFENSGGRTAAVTGEGWTTVWRAKRAARRKRPPPRKRAATDPCWIR